MTISYRICPSRRRALWLPGILAVVMVSGTSSLLPVFAQSTTPSAISPQIYRLAKTSTYQHGCFAPCLCPVMEQGSEEGTFVLTPSGSTGLFKNFAVSEVNWTVTLPSGPIRVTGSGTYKVGGGVPVQQDLSLDLVVGSNTVQHFDSGLVAGGGDFPRISATISINGVYCLDTVFMIDASPVPISEIQSYRLFPGSTFQRSCSGPCACPIGAQLPMQGTFSLVELDSDPLFANYAVVMVDWLVAPDGSSNASSYLPVTGSGMYRLGGEVAVEQQMSLDLMVGQQPPVLFDSGLVPGGQAFPRINVKLVNGAGSCVTTAMGIYARPAPFRATAATPAAP